MKLPLSCPVHHKPLELHDREWKTRDGAMNYPTVGQVPWLFPDARHVLAEWRERASLSIQHLENEIASLKVAAKQSAPSQNTSPLRRARLERLRVLKIRHLEMLRKVLDPLKPGTKLSLPRQTAFGYRLPLRQGLLGYFPNLIRDWSGEFENENEALFKSTLELVTKSGLDAKRGGFRILVLGAGGSRLAYDLAQHLPQAAVVAFDLNPVLLLSAKLLNDGMKIQAVDFPISPIDSSQPGREVELKASRGTASNLEFVFGDVYALPFEAGVFDLCITPWLVDILPRRLEDLCRTVAHVVKADGAWINSGSWHFSFRDESENLSLGEAREEAAKNGWVHVAEGHLEIPYLQSKCDSHRRYETLTQFVWRRTSDAVTVTPPIDDRAPWIRDSSLPIPRQDAFVNGAEIHAIMALILSLVDGQKSLSEIASVLAAENGLTDEQALEAAQSFFDRFVKDRHFRENP